MSKRSSGSYKPHRGFNKYQMRDGQIVIMNKNGTEKMRLDRETKQPVKAK